MKTKDIILIAVVAIIAIGVVSFVSNAASGVSTGFSNSPTGQFLANPVESTVLWLLSPFDDVPVDDAGGDFG